MHSARADNYIMDQRALCSRVEGGVGGARSGGEKGVKREERQWRMTITHRMSSSLSLIKNRPGGGDWIEGQIAAQIVEVGTFGIFEFFLW